MAHYGTLRDFAFNKEVDIDDIRGSAVYGVDNDKLGKIDDVIFDHASGDLRYVVVDTGGWLSSKKFLVPADRIHDYEKDEDAFQVDLTKEHIERFPRYDEDKMQSDADWKDYEGRYKAGWDEAPVQHQEGRLDLNVTPADVSGIQPREVRAQRDVNVPMGSLGEEVADIRETDIRDRDTQEDLAGRDLTPQRLAGKFPTPIQGSHKISMSPSHVEERDLDQARVGSERVPDRAWEDNPTGASGRFRQAPTREGEAIQDSQEFDRDREHLERDSDIHRADVGQWHPRMKRFEDVLRKNRVDVTASCPSCGCAKEDKAA